MNSGDNTSSVKRRVGTGALRYASLFGLVLSSPRPHISAAVTATCWTMKTRLLKNVLWVISSFQIFHGSQKPGSSLK